MDRQAHLEQLVADAFDRSRDGAGAPFELLAGDVTWASTGANPLGGAYASREALPAALDPLDARLSEPVRPTTTPELFGRVAAG